MSKVKVTPIDDYNYANNSTTSAAEAQSTQQAESNIFQDLDNWENSHADASIFSESYEEYLNSDTAKQIGLHFDFMQGADVKDEQAYNAQTLKLAQGEINQKDKSKDGSLSFEEYYFNPAIMSDIETYKQFIESGEVNKDDVIDLFAQNLEMANKVFNIIDGCMGNGNGELDAAELQQYYQHLDEFNSDSSERVRDGKIGLKEVTDYPEYLANQVKISENIYQSIKNYVASIFS